MRHGWILVATSLMASVGLAQTPPREAVTRHGADAGTRAKAPTPKEIVIAPAAEPAPPEPTRPGCVDTPPGLVSWWPGNGNTRDVVGPNEARPWGKASYTAGKVGLAFSFDGTNNAAIGAGSAGFPSGAQDRTLELWVRVDDSVAKESIFACHGYSNAEGGTYKLGRNEETWRVFFSTGARVIEGPRLAIPSWHHVAVVTQGGRTSLYFDGDEVGSEYLPLDTPSGSGFMMGAFPGLGSFKGALDEVSVYNRALTALEIRRIYLAGSAGKCPPL